MSRNPKDYSKGKIYCIRNTINDDIYIGSTCQSLSQRMVQHRRDMTARQHMKLYKSMTELERENFYIELLEEYPCENFNQLTKREGQLIRQHQSALNQLINGRTKKEYYDDNKHKVKEHYEQNRDIKLQQVKQYYEQNKGAKLEYAKQYRDDNKRKIQEKSKIHYDEHKEDIKQQKKEYYQSNKERERENKKIYNEKQQRKSARSKQTTLCKKETIEGKLIIFNNNYLLLNII